VCASGLRWFTSFILIKSLCNKSVINLPLKQTVSNYYHFFFTITSRQLAYNPTTRLSVWVCIQYTPSDRRCRVLIFSPVTSTVEGLQRVSPPATNVVWEAAQAVQTHVVAIRPHQDLINFKINLSIGHGFLWALCSLHHTEPTTETPSP